MATLSRTATKGRLPFVAMTASDVDPADGFAGQGSVAGRDVKCLTPGVQMLCHSTGYRQGETDFHDMRLLNARFGTPLAPPFDAS